jgi:hypothetical protein
MLVGLTHARSCVRATHAMAPIIAATAMVNTVRFP